MVDPRVRQVRLTNDLEKLGRIRCEAIDFDAISPPVPERYEVRFRLRSLLGHRGTTPIYTPDGHIHRVEIKLPPAYPERLSNSDVKFLSTPIFHPNVFTDGTVCIRSYNPSESLAQFVLRLAHYIQCDPVFTGLDSPANVEAREFFAANPGLFPADRTVLPTGEVKRMFKEREAVPANGPATNQPVQAGCRAFVVHSPSAPPSPRKRFVVTGTTQGGSQ